MSTTLQMIPSQVSSSHSVNASNRQMRGVVYAIGAPPRLQERLTELLHAEAFQVVGCDDVESFLSTCDPNEGVCAILDLFQLSGDGLTTLARLTACGGPGPAVIVTAQTDVRSAVQAMQLGVADVVPKPFSDETLVQAVRRCAELRENRRQRLQQTQAAAASMQTLTAREKEILGLLAEGHATRQVAHRLCRSAKTIQKHTANLMRKLDVHNRVDLVRRALQAGLIDL